MKRMIPISFVSLILASAAIGGWILFESRDGGEGSGGDPGEGSPDESNNENDSDPNSNENITGPDPEPYDGPDVVVNDTQQDNETDPDDGIPGGPDINQSDPDPLKDNETEKDPDELPDPPDNFTGEDPDELSDPSDNITEETGNKTGPEEGNKTDPRVDSPYLNNGSLQIEGIGTFEFDSGGVKTTRPDVFAGGHISLFDILVYLDNTGSIDLNYHFDEGMDTFVIDTLNGSGDWWYWSHYSGGWQESNAWRMDLYPYKDSTTIMVYHEEDWFIERIFDSFRAQVQRRTENNGKVIIPKVIIEAPSGNLEFNDVEVTSHDLRNDSFREGIITAIDVIMSLGDQGLITYELKWYETIAGADPVRNYWVEAINSDKAYGTCGFVYEAGEENMGGRNHIHIPSDQRVLTSPEYEMFFWICL